MYRNISRGCKPVYPDRHTPEENRSIQKISCPSVKDSRCDCSCKQHKYRSDQNRQGSVPGNDKEWFETCSCVRNELDKHKEEYCDKNPDYEGHDKSGYCTNCTEYPCIVRHADEFCGCRSCLIPENCCKNSVDCCIEQRKFERVRTGRICKELFWME